MDITADREEKSWNVVIRYQLLQFAFTSKRVCNVVHKKYRNVVESRSRALFWRQL